MNEAGKAYEYYYQSLEGARELGWLQQICEIDLHLGRLMLEDKKFADAFKAFEEAKTMAKYINLSGLHDEASTLLAKVMAKQKPER